MFKFNFIILFFFLLPLVSVSQVVNGNFEIVKPNFLPSNWGMNFFQPVVINTETGEATADQIQYTWCIPSMVYASFDSQSGQYAMEISNAFNTTQNHVITGEVSIFSDSTQDMPGWNPGIALGQFDEVSILGFHYKFLPIGNDIAQAQIQVFDAESNEIGSANIDISGTNTDFHYIQTPILYTSNAAPALMYIKFIMAKEGTNPTFGSRLIIDNVVTNLSALANTTNNNNTDVTIFPTFVEDEIFVYGKGQLDYKIINLEGKVIEQNSIQNYLNNYSKIEVGNICSGVYLLCIKGSNGQFTKKFIKK